MKKSLTIKLLASAAVIATAAPIISLASCSKQSKPIDIDPSEKTKQIEKGARQAIYTIKVDGLGTNESLFATIEDATSTQASYKVAITKAVEYDSKTSTASVTVDIISSNNELIKDGTEFEFSLAVEKRDAQGKTLATAKFEGFKLVYGVPTTRGLILQGNARTYSDPASPTHTYLYTVSPTLEVDSDCEFECDVEKKFDGSTPEVNIKCDKVTYDAASGCVLVKFLLFCNIRDVGEGDIVNFSYTLSCKKNGKELWRQQFNNYQIEYLYHVMWILEDYQDTQTYAGNKQFNLYIIKNEFISSEMLDDDSIKLEVTDPANAGITLSWNKDTITTKQYQSEIGVIPYFEVPVTINGEIAADTQIKYKATLEGYIGGGKTTRVFDNLQIKYITNKAIEPQEADRTVYLNNVKQTSFTFTLNKALEFDESISCEFVKTTGDSKTQGTTTTKVNGTTVTVDVKIDNDKLVDTVGFNLILTCKKAGTLEWEQLSTKYSIKTYDTLQVQETNVIAKKEAPENPNAMGSIEFKACGDIVSDADPTIDGGVRITNTDLTITSKTNVKEAIPVVKHQGSKLYLEVTLVPEDNGALDSNSQVTFDVTLTGNVNINGTVQSWQKTFTGLQVRYDEGKMKWEDGWFIKECIVERTGKTYSDTINTEFSLAQALTAGQTLEAKVDIDAGQSSSSYIIELMGKVSTEGTKVLVPMRLARSESSMTNKIYFGDHVFYSITFTCKDTDGKTLWDQKINDCYIYALANFVITDAEKTKKSKIPANIAVTHTVSIPTTRIGFKFETSTDNFRPQGTCPADAAVDPSESLKVHDENKSIQVVRWRSTTGLHDNDVIIYDMHIKVTFTQYLYDPISYTFDFNDLKLIFATEE